MALANGQACAMQPGCISCATSHNTPQCMHWAVQCRQCQTVPSTATTIKPQYTFSKLLACSR